MVENVEVLLDGGPAILEGGLSLLAICIPKPMKAGLFIPPDTDVSPLVIS